jgi:hypothetical protein
MNFRKSILAGICAVSLGAISVPLTASATTVYLNIAPPEARYEAVPAPRAGYVWSSGYWDAKNDKHVWRKGHWEQERHGYHYAQSTWTQHENGWKLERSHWNKADRDGDGVPNNVDRAPDNPNRH